MRREYVTNSRASMLQGVFAPLVTPFSRDGSLDPQLSKAVVQSVAPHVRVRFSQ